MRKNVIEVQSATVLSLQARKDCDQTVVTLVKPEDPNFANMYGVSGLQVDIDKDKIEELEIVPGMKVNCIEIGYHLITALRPEEVREEVGMPKNLKAYAMNEIVTKLEAYDQGLISESQRDEFFSVVATIITPVQEQKTSTTQKEAEAPAPKTEEKVQ
jgi:hypothetical protein